MSFHPMPRYLMRKHILKKILKEINCEKKELLEIGYGAGEVFNMYQNLGIKIHGYDFSKDAYNYVLQNNKNNSMKLYKQENDIELGKFDILVACEVLEHIKDDKAAVLNWKKYLKKENSYLIISVPAHKNRWDDSDILVGHIRRYESTELKQLLSSCGFDVKKIYTYDFPSNLLLDKIRKKRAIKMIKSDGRGNDLLLDTQKSGLERDNNKIYRFLSNESFLFPLMKFQELFYNTDLGSAYILVSKLK